MTKSTARHSAIKGDSYITTLHRDEVTHAMFQSGIIVPIHDVFTIMDAMHETPTKFLVEGWTLRAETVRPEFDGSWLKVERNTWWVMGPKPVDEMGFIMSLGAGSSSPFTVISREFVK